MKQFFSPNNRSLSQINLKNVLIEKLRLTKTGTHIIDPIVTPRQVFHAPLQHNVNYRCAIFKLQVFNLFFENLQF